VHEQLDAGGAEHGAGTDELAPEELLDGAGVLALLDELLHHLQGVVAAAQHEVAAVRRAGQQAEDEQEGQAQAAGVQEHGAGEPGGRVEQDEDRCRQEDLGDLAPADLARTLGERLPDGAGGHS